MSEQQQDGGRRNFPPAPFHTPASYQDDDESSPLEEFNRRLSDLGPPFDGAVLQISRIKYRILAEEGQPITEKDQYGILAKDDTEQAFIGGFPTLTLLNAWIAKCGDILTATRSSAFDHVDRDTIGTDNYFGPVWLSLEHQEEMAGMTADEEADDEIELDPAETMGPHLG